MRPRSKLDVLPSSMLPFQSMSLLAVGGGHLARQWGTSLAAVGAARDVLQELLYTRTFTHDQAAILAHSYHTSVEFEQVRRVAEAVAACCKVQWLDPAEQTSLPKPFL